MTVPGGCHKHPWRYVNYNNYNKNFPESNVANISASKIHIPLDSGISLIGVHSKGVIGQVCKAKRINVEKKQHFPVSLENFKPRNLIIDSIKITQPCIRI